MHPITGKELLEGQVLLRPNKKKSWKIFFVSFEEYQQKNKGVDERQLQERYKELKEQHDLDTAQRNKESTRLRIWKRKKRSRRGPLDFTRMNNDPKGIQVDEWTFTATYPGTKLIHFGKNGNFAPRPILVAEWLEANPGKTEADYKAEFEFETVDGYDFTEVIHRARKDIRDRRNDAAFTRWYCTEIIEKKQGGTFCCGSTRRRCPRERVTLPPTPCPDEERFQALYQTAQAEDEANNDPFLTKTRTALWSTSDADHTQNNLVKKGSHPRPNASNFGNSSRRQFTSACHLRKDFDQIKANYQGFGNRCKGDHRIVSARDRAKDMSYRIPLEAFRSHKFDEFMKQGGCAGPRKDGSCPCPQGQRLLEKANHILNIEDPVERDLQKSEFSIRYIVDDHDKGARKFDPDCSPDQLHGPKLNKLRSSESLHKKQIVTRRCWECNYTATKTTDLADFHEDTKPCQIRNTFEYKKIFEWYKNEIREGRYHQPPLDDGSIDDGLDDDMVDGGPNPFDDDSDDDGMDDDPKSDNNVNDESNPLLLLAEVAARQSVG